MARQTGGIVVERGAMQEVVWRSGIRTQAARGTHCWRLARSPRDEEDDGVRGVALGSWEGGGQGADLGAQLE